MSLDFPFRISPAGRSARTDHAEHVGDMVELLLFTRPGERVNRPRFGTGLFDLVFAPNSLELAAHTRLEVQSALERWLGDVISVQELQVEATGELLTVRLVYVIIDTGEQRDDTFPRSAR